MVPTKAVLDLLAYDLGAESGRAMLGHFDGERLGVDEIYRFPNNPVRVNQHLYSDVLRLWSEIQTGLQMAHAQSETGLASLGVDTWGVDFALLDKDDRLLGNPFHYRDPHTQGSLDAALKCVSREEIYTQTGNQLIEFNTLFQLVALQQAENPILQAAHSLLMLPDLFHFWLSGEKSTEVTIASTSQCFNPYEFTWATDLLQRLELPIDIFQPVVPAGSLLGRLQPWLADQVGCEPIPVIAPACHDTGSAVAAIPVSKPDFMYISSGTWSLIGVELEKPLINAYSLSANLANEGGVGGRIRLLKITPGMWLLQQCRNEWARRGLVHTYADLTQMAAEAPDFGPLVAVGAQEFAAPGDVPERIQAYCRRTRQSIPQTVGEIVRCILESLAVEYRLTLEELETLLDWPVSVIHIIGGGSRNSLLNQLTADITHRPVIAGPVEATVAGNLLVQAMGLGQLASLDELRQVTRNSFETQIFEPRPNNHWEEAYDRVRQLKTYGDNA